jgi:serine/threonine protein kinase
VTSLSDDALTRLRTAATEASDASSRYLLLRELGRGGMGTVWLAHDSELDREVALKVIREGSDANADAVERLAREARILARLEHPGIVPVHDVGRLPGGPLFYVMKRVEGERLDRHFPPETPLSDRLRLFQRLCETVAFAHAHGVVHRDLKPENVMVGRFGEVLVLDWGVAKVLADGDPPRSSAGGAPRPGETAEGTVLGTLEYTSPEQLEGRVEELSPRSDIFALGAILYFLAARRAPFADRGRERVAPGGARRPPLPLRRVDSSLPKPLEAIVTRAMAPEPAQRYASAEALGEDIARLIDGLPVSAHPENLLERTGRLLRRHRVAATLILVYLAVRVLILAVGGR